MSLILFTFFYSKYIVLLKMNFIIDQEFVDDTIFKHPFTCMLAGPTMSGKTAILNKIRKNYTFLFDKKIDRIIYCYARWQNTYDKMKLVKLFEEFNRLCERVAYCDTDSIFYKVRDGEYEPNLGTNL